VQDYGATPIGFLNWIHRGNTYIFGWRRCANKMRCAATGGDKDDQLADDIFQFGYLCDG
jgi:hypothetical protein